MYEVDFPHQKPHRISLEIDTLQQDGLKQNQIGFFAHLAAHAETNERFQGEYRANPVVYGDKVPDDLRADIDILVEYGYIEAVAQIPMTPLLDAISIIIIITPKGLHISGRGQYA